MELKQPADNLIGAFVPQPSIMTGYATSEDYTYCRQVMRSASKNYSFASRFLPKNKLPHVEALYALLRVGDDRVDVSHDGFKTPQAAIEDWEQTYWRAFETENSPHPVMRAYLDTAINFGIPKETMAPYFRAMKEDLAITRFPTFDHLAYYMECSALVVGRAMTYILGVEPPYTLQDALSGADSLSTAMQLSNFWRDIGHDWSIGRVYLPQEDMEQFGVSENDLADRRITPQFIDLLEFQIERSEHYYEHAREHIKMLASGQWGVMCGLEIYRAILSSIRRNRYDVFNHRSGANTWQKAGLVITAYWQTRSL